MSKKILYRLLSPAMWGNILCVGYILTGHPLSMLFAYLYLVLTIAAGLMMMRAALRIRGSNDIHKKAEYKRHVDGMLPSNLSICMNILVDTSVIIFAILGGLPGLALAKFVSVVPGYFLVLDVRQDQGVIWPQSYNDGTFKNLMLELYKED